MKQAITCPYCDSHAVRTIGWYFDCDEGHTFHMTDWSSELREGVTA